MILFSNVGGEETGGYKTINGSGYLQRRIVKIWKVRSRGDAGGSISVVGEKNIDYEV